jgi:hypothetical protein
MMVLRLMGDSSRSCTRAAQEAPQQLVWAMPLSFSQEQAVELL